MFNKITQILILSLAFIFLSTACKESAERLDEPLVGLEEDGSNKKESIDAGTPIPILPDEEGGKGSGEDAEEPFNPNKNPANTKAFTTLPNGKRLSSIKVRDSRLRLAKGIGKVFSSSKKRAYDKLKEESMRDPSHKVQWTFMNLDTHEVIERSGSAHKKIFGASSSKVYVAAALLDKEEGDLSNSQMQRMADMLVVSSNKAWTSLQKNIGNGSSNRGREYIHNFTQDLGYELTRGFQGYWGDLHGNELVPDEAVEMLYDTYHNQFMGAETLWKIMYTCRTGASRGRKYIPKSIYVGGKTGTYSGPTENPETGKEYNVRVRNHMLIFNIDGVQYGLAIFANDGSNESVALLTGGLIREYAGIE